MPKNSRSIAPNKHHTTLAGAIDHVSSLLLFGKIVSDLQTTTEGHQFAHVYGYRQNGKCQRLDNPTLLSLPEPIGPANECGFDPEQFVMWNVPESFLSTALHVERAPITGILTRQTAQHPTAGISLFSGVAAVPLVGQHPTTGQANAIVLKSVAPEFPNATLSDAVGSLYPLQSERVIFVSRVVSNTAAAGFKIQPAKVPSGDTDSLGGVSAAVVANASA